MAYKAEWDEYDAAVKAGEHPIPPRKDLKLEALKEVLEGKRYVHAHCYRADEILMLIRIADDYGFKIRTFQHVLEGYKVAEEIAAHGAGASTFSDWWGYKMEAYRRDPLQRRDDGEEGHRGQPEQRRRRADAAPEHRSRQGDEVRRRFTRGCAGDGDLNPAKQLGIDNRVGSIEVGKDADMVIYDKDPLSEFAKVQKVLIDGNKYFDRDQEVSGRAAKEAEKQKLLETEKQDQPQGRGARSPQ